MRYENFLQMYFTFLTIINFKYFNVNRINQIQTGIFLEYLKTQLQKIILWFLIVIILKIHFVKNVLKDIINGANNVK